MSFQNVYYLLLKKKAGEYQGRNVMIITTAKMMFLVQVVDCNNFFNLGQLRLKLYFYQLFVKFYK